LTASNLALRVVSAAIMAPIAIAVAWLGDWPFALFWGAAALAVLWEWIGLVIGPRHGTILSRAVWTTAGVGYAGALLLAPLLLRSDAQYGFFAILWLFAIVWSTDIVAYFAGRALGGPKLAPAISPKKTWSGAIAGTLGATLFAVLMARFADGLVVPPAGAFNLGTIAIIGVLLSVLSQTGDLLESWIKRRFGAKDASGLIPGHGGVMDRLDGFWAAAVAGCVLGLVRGGFENPARGLLIW
jgi:phosphatidate cytidylyltransferase